MQNNKIIYLNYLFFSFFITKTLTSFYFLNKICKANSLLNIYNISTADNYLIIL